MPAVLESLITSSVVCNGILQGTTYIGISVHESLPMPWTRVCLEMCKCVDSIGHVRACHNLGPHKAHNCRGVRLVGHE